MPFCIGWVENFDEMTYLASVNRSKFLPIFGKNLNQFKMPPFLGKGNLENAIFRYPMGRIEMNCILPRPVSRAKILAAIKSLLQDYIHPCGLKISTKFYLAWLRR